MYRAILALLFCKLMDLIEHPFCLVNVKVQIERQINHLQKLVRVRFISCTVTEPPPPEYVQAIRTSPSTVIVRWREPKRNNIIASYRIFYYTHELEDMSVWDHIDTEGPTTTALLVDLIPQNSYAIRMQSKSINERWSNLTKVVTTNYIPVGEFMFENI